MNFLHLLAALRTPFWDAVFGAVTYLGDETFFIAAALFIFWCVDKRGGYFLLTVGFFGIILNETLKLLFRIPRPWILDPSFSPVESALGRAVGYSFPSGHTQNAACLFGSCALLTKNKSLRILCAVLFCLVAFSRLYLGVHTPLDVGVSALCALFLLAIFAALFRRFGESSRFFAILIGCMLISAVGFLIFASQIVEPNPLLSENAASGVTHGCYILGGIIGFAIGYSVEKHFIRFKTDAPVGGQVLKLAIGFFAVIGIKSALKAPLLLLFHGSPAAHTLRYAIVVLFAVAVYPLTFPLFARVGTKRKTAER